MNTARYIVGVVLLISLPPGLLLWFAIHPFIRFWCKLGAGWTYTVLSPFVVVLMAILFLLRDELLGIDLGTHYVLLVPTALCLVVGTVIAVIRRRHLRYSVLVGMPELSKSNKGTLLTDGIYGSIRHPRYVEVLFWSLAYALFANYLGGYVAVGLCIPALYLIVVLEERELRGRFGAEYAAYCRRVPRFIPRCRTPSNLRGGAI